MTVQLPIYLDNHSTTRVDPRVVDAMLPYFSEQFGNAASITHSFGHAAKEAVETAREKIAGAINASPSEIVFTSGATESNNLAIYGVARHRRARGKHIVSVATEHKAVLDPLKRLEKEGFEVTLLPVENFRSHNCGLVDLSQLAESVRDDTCLVTIMTANNEIGTIQPIREISAICADREIPFHTDAAQAVGKLDFDVKQNRIDLVSFTAHKIHGPKGIGVLYIRSGAPRVRLQAQIDGGGHENGLRSGTLNVPAIIGFARAIELAVDELNEGCQSVVTGLRNQLFEGIKSGTNGVELNGPSLETNSSIASSIRLPGNLNCRFDLVDGEAMAMHMANIAVSTGSACTSANPEPSHVLRAIGLTEDQARSSIRFGLSRFTTQQEIMFAIETICDKVKELRKLSSMN